MDSKYIPRTQFDRIILNQEADLFAKFYSERFINSTERSGEYITKLRSAFQKSVNSVFWDARRDFFKVDMTGIFVYESPLARKAKSPIPTKSKDTLKFEFQYRYDPMNNKLILVSMNATLNNEYIRAYEINGNASKNLPSSISVHHELATLRDQALLRTSIHEKVHSRKSHKIS